MAKNKVYLRPDGRHTRAYNIWRGIRQRCHNPECRDYPAYGARGITICQQWATFEGFLADMGEPPEGVSLDRRDNDKEYSKGNCRWATPLQQNNNMRSNRNILFDGEIHSISEWERFRGFKRTTVLARLKRGWNIDQALTVPGEEYHRRGRD